MFRYRPFPQGTSISLIQFLSGHGGKGDGYSDAHLGSFSQHCIWLGPKHPTAKLLSRSSFFKKWWSVIILKIVMVIFRIKLLVISETKIMVMMIRIQIRTRFEVGTKMSKRWVEEMTGKHDRGFASPVGCEPFIVGKRGARIHECWRDLKNWENESRLLPGRERVRENTPHF